MSNSLSLAELPPAVQRYLALREGAEAASAADLFAEHAVVSDEGRTHTGREQIRAWIDDTNASYEYTKEFLGAREAEGMTAVLFRLTGDFPGGEVDLEYQFRLDDAGRIAHLYFA